MKLDINAMRMRRSQLENSVATAARDGLYKNVMAYSAQIISIDSAIATGSDLVIEDGDCEARSLVDKAVEKALLASWRYALESGEKAQEYHRSLARELCPIAYTRNLNDGGLTNGEEN